MNPGDIFHDHEIENELGGGEFGTVYKARQQPSGNLVALKISKDTGDDLDIKRFGLENQVLYTLHPHKNIIEPKSKVSQHAERIHYYTMELADHSLNDHLYKHHDELSFSDRLQIMADICDGIEHAHNKNISHRDLHVENILIKLNEEVIVKITDFGRGKNFNEVTISKGNKPCWGNFVSPPEVFFKIKDDDKNILDHIPGDMYALGILTHFIFKNAPTIEISGLRKNISSFLQSQKIKIEDLSETERKLLYKEWVENTPEGQQYFNITLLDNEESEKVNYLLSRLTNIDHSKRFENISTLKKEIIKLST